MLKQIIPIPLVCMLLLFCGCTNQAPIDVVITDTQANKVDQQEEKPEELSDEEEPAPDAEQDFSISSESIGGLSLGLDEAAVTGILGQPDEATDPEEWGSDGLMHKNFTYKDLGIDIGLVDNSGAFVIFSVSVTAPYDGATSEGIRIGSTEAEVVAAYGNHINTEDSAVLENSIVVGSIFEGLVFNMASGSVETMFLGASAE